MPADRATVFYSWQSNTPSEVNRSFIEEALVQAIEKLNNELALESAQRPDAVEPDKDRKGVSGSPPTVRVFF